MQRILCLKHGVEIIWHRFYKLVDGETSGPSTLKGPVGKQIAGNIFYTMKIVNFQPVKPAPVAPNNTRAPVADQGRRT